VFPGVDARLSRYSYLVSLLPDRIVSDLGLRLTLRSRSVASFTPVRRSGKDVGLLVERDPGPATAASFRELTGGDAEHAAWQSFYDQALQLAEAVAPTLLEPLLPAAEMRRRVGPERWDRFVDRPIGETIEASFADDTVRGVVLTDALIGTFASAHQADRLQNRCFLYHLIGNGTGEWRVPVGGMGAVTAELARVAQAAGAQLVTGATVVGVAADGGREGEVTYHLGDDSERVVGSRWLLAGVAPSVLDALRGRSPSGAAADGTAAEGAQMKVNMVLERLPALRSGHDPAVAFAGTFHIDEDYSTLDAAFATATAGALPDPLPGEVYCHTLTDPSILSPELAARGVHTLTLFGLHAPARLFTPETNATLRDEALRRHLAGLDAYLAEPIAGCLAHDAEGRPCIEAVTPLDLEASLGLPGGNIFHADLSWPWSSDGTGDSGSAHEAGSWGVETDVPNLLICGAGAVRGGGVSGLGGHNAAHALLARL
jgi:phytoene dehydrogenase-like protein